MRVISREGLAAATVRKIAAELDVTAMAIYRHVATKDELLDLIPDHLVAGLADDVATAPQGVDALSLIAQRLGAVLSQRPAAAPLFNRPQVGPNMREAAGICIDKLADQGCDRARAAGLLRATVAMVIGLQVTGGESADTAFGPIAQDAVEVWLRGVAEELN